MKFDEDNSHIVAMRSLEGENVPLKRPVEITTQVEVRIIYCKILLQYTADCNLVNIVFVNLH